jgi:uncharacterized membrane protein
MALRALHPLKGERNFRWRGDTVSRLEALSDIVFGFALGMLLVNASGPESFAELTNALWAGPGMAAAFALVLLIWHGHYLYFRRYDLEDGTTLTLNAILLFLLLFLVYALKFLISLLSEATQFAFGQGPAPKITLGEARDALMLYSGFYAAVFAVFALLYGHALRRANALALTADERRASRHAVYESLVHGGVAGAVVAMAWSAPLQIAPFTGFLFFLIGPLSFLLWLAYRSPRDPKESA